MGLEEKYKGIFPAFYACYDDAGELSVEATEALLEYLIDAGVQGVYVGGSSGECIYQTVEERKLVLETVMNANNGRIKVIAHIAANSTRDSQELARHAESLAVDAIASIPPIYFKLPEFAIAKYWNDMSEAAPNTDFIIYNIPQLAGVSLTPSLLETLLENPRVIGVKNSSMPVQDIQIFRSIAQAKDREFIVFNGPDEQLFSGLAAGAVGGIGGTYGAAPKLYLAIYDAYLNGDTARGLELQDIACDLINSLVATKGNMYASIKKSLEVKHGLKLGSVRAPLAPLVEEDNAVIDEIVEKLNKIEVVLNG